MLRGGSETAKRKERISTDESGWRSGDVSSATEGTGPLPPERSRSLRPHSTGRINKNPAVPPSGTRVVSSRDSPLFSPPFSPLWGPSSSSSHFGPLNFQLPDDGSGTIHDGEVLRQKGKYHKRWVTEQLIIQHNILLTCSSTKPLQIKKCIALSSLHNVQPCGSKKEPYRLALHYNVLDKHKKLKMATLHIQLRSSKDSEKWMALLNEQITKWHNHPDQPLLEFIEKPFALTKIDRLQRAVRSAGFAQLTCRLFNALQARQFVMLRDAFYKMGLQSAENRVQRMNEHVTIQTQQQSREMGFFLLINFFTVKVRRYFSDFNLTVRKQNLQQSHQEAGVVLANILLETEMGQAKNVMQWRIFHLRTSLHRAVTRVLLDAFQRVHAFSKVRQVLTQMRGAKLRLLMCLRHSIDQKDMRNCLTIWRTNADLHKRRVDKLQALFRKNCWLRRQRAFVAWRTSSIDYDYLRCVAVERLVIIIGKTISRKHCWGLMALTSWTKEVEKQRVLHFCTNVQSVHADLVSAYNLVPIDRGLSALSVFVCEFRRRTQRVCLMKLAGHAKDILRLQRTCISLNKRFQEIRRRSMYLGLRAFWKHARLTQRDERKRKDGCGLLLFVLSSARLKALGGGFYRLRCLSEPDTKRASVIVRRVEETLRRLRLRSQFDAFLCLKAAAKESELLRCFARLHALQRLVGFADRCRISSMARAMNKLQRVRHEPEQRIEYEPIAEQEHRIGHEPTMEQTQWPVHEPFVKEEEYESGEKPIGEQDHRVALESIVEQERLLVHKSARVEGDQFGDESIMDQEERSDNESIVDQEERSDKESIMDEEEQPDHESIMDEDEQPDHESFRDQEAWRHYESTIDQEQQLVHMSSIEDEREQSVSPPEWRASIAEWRSSLPEWRAPLPEWPAEPPDWSSALPEWSSALPEWSSGLPEWPVSLPEWPVSLPESPDTLSESPAAVIERAAAALSERAAGLSERPVARVPTTWAATHAPAEWHAVPIDGRVSQEPNTLKARPKPLPPKIAKAYAGIPFSRPMRRTGINSSRNDVNETPAKKSFAAAITTRLTPIAPSGGTGEPSCSMLFED